MRHVSLTRVFQFFNHTLPAGFYCAGGYNFLSPFFTNNYLAVENSGLTKDIYKVINEDGYILYMGYDRDEAIKTKEGYDQRNYREAICGYVIIFNGRQIDYSDYYKALVDLEKFNKQIKINNQEIRRLKLAGYKLSYNEEAKIFSKCRNEGRIAEIIREPFFLSDNQFILAHDKGKDVIRYGVDGSKKVLLFVSEEFYKSNDCEIKSNGNILLKDKYEIDQNKFGLAVIAILDKDQFVAFLNNKNKIIYKWDGDEVIKSFAE